MIMGSYIFIDKCSNKKNKLMARMKKVVMFNNLIRLFSLRSKSSVIPLLFSLYQNLFIASIIKN